MIDDFIENLLELKRKTGSKAPIYVQVNNSDQSSDVYTLIEHEITLKIDKYGWIGLIVDNGGGIG